MIKIKRMKVNDFLSYLAILVAFFCATNGELMYTSSTAVYYLPFLLCFAALALELIAVKKRRVSSYMIWRIFLCVFFFLAYLYAVNESAAFSVIKRILLQSVVVFLIGIKCTDDAENIQRIAKIAVAAVCINLLYLYSVVDFATLAEGERLGVSSVNESWNSNQIGLMASLGVAMVCYLFFIKAQETRRFNKVFGAALIVFFLFFVVLSGSRKSLIIVFVTLMVYLFGSSKSHKTRKIVIAIACTYGLLYALYNVPFLYDHIGYRFEGLIETISGTGSEGSAQARQGMIDIGLNAFIQKPLFGYGLNGFSQVYGEITGISVYSHNNYVELLVNTGLVGFVLYYGYIVWILFRRCGANKESALFKAVLAALLVADVGLISYTDSFCQYILCLVICGILKKPDFAPERELLQQ